MAKKKQILISDILNLMSDNHEVVCLLYAYGIYYADTQRDGMKTVAECKDQMNYDCLHALVTRIKFDDHAKKIVIEGEIVH